MIKSPAAYTWNYRDPTKVGKEMKPVHANRDDGDDSQLKSEEQNTVNYQRKDLF